MLLLILLVVSTFALVLFGALRPQRHPPLVLHLDVPPDRAGGQSSTGSSELRADSGLRANSDLRADSDLTAISAVDHGLFGQILQNYGENGGLNYQLLHENPRDRARLKSYLAEIAAISPESHPDAFPSRQDEMLYWVSAYNALVIDAILENWPIKSVTDVRAPLEVVRGFGFFYCQQYMVGRRYYNLYHLERKKILASYQDARLHFMLNCGSGGCPALPRRLPAAVELEEELERAAVEFINDAENIYFEPATARLYISQIFQWYRSEFLRDQKRAGRPVSLLGYIQHYAHAPLSEILLDNPTPKIVFLEYDWSLNGTGTERATQATKTD
ncbi:MAG: DUF547 domain-containing protein [Polyangiaceae bacterium]|nr:DUF547 domain-containing protein [Polyangiaceae bacterium]